MGLFGAGVVVGPPRGGGGERGEGGGCLRAERAAFGGGDGERSERGGVGERSERRGGPASEASLPLEASQVVAEGDGLRVRNISFYGKVLYMFTIDYGPSFHHSISNSMFSNQKGRIISVCSDFLLQLKNCIWCQKT